MIINLTQHAATPDQVQAGVVDLYGVDQLALRVLLKFRWLPSASEIAERAELLAELAVHNGLGEDDGDDPFPDAAMIGGAPYLMAPLERALAARGIKPVYAFSLRVSSEVTLPDGSVEKRAQFQHQGFVGL